MDVEKYRRAIYERVCRHCIDFGIDGKCTLPPYLKCGVELYLEKIVRAVHSVKSTKIDDYTKALRDYVCVHCRNVSADGRCRLRETLDCGLDRYFELVVEAIEEVDGASDTF